MHSNPEDFDKLKKLLALKRHECPPPGYFDRLSRRISSEIQSTQEQKSRIALFFDLVSANRLRIGWSMAGACCALLLVFLQLTSMPSETLIQSDPAMRARTPELGGATTASMISKTNPAAASSSNRYPHIIPLPLDSLFERFESTPMEPAVFQPVEE